MQKFILSFCCLFACCLIELNGHEIKAVIFDFGGVIAQPDREPFIKFISKSFHLSPEKAVELLRKWRNDFEKGGDERKFWTAHMASQKMDASQMASWFSEWEGVKATTMKEIPGMLQLVKELQMQGYQTPLFSNVTEDWAKVIRHQGMYKPFKTLFLSYEMGLVKPDRRAYEKVLGELHLPPNACLFIDDKIENVKAAQEVGIDAIHFIAPDQLREELLKRGIEVQHAAA